jgi:signal peptidase II
VFALCRQSANAGRNPADLLMATGSGTGTSAGSGSSPGSGSGSGQWRWLWLTALLIALDQWSKAAIVQRFALGESLTVWPVFNVVRAHNLGVAFSLFDHEGGWQRWAFSALAAVVSAVLIVWLRRLPRAANLTALSLALILAGAVGNLIDRARQGYVVDFVQVHWNENYFPAFNVADSAITVGAILMLLDAWVASRQQRVRT